jgi:RND family efflux transporter MFP subunit
MNDKSALLGQLKIEREPLEAPRRRWPWILGAVLALVAAAGLYLLMRPDPAIPIKTATVLSVGNSANAGSVLDASGYVVARRQATVSSKVTGKVLEVRVEEGQSVKAGEVLARIDDSNARTQLDLSVSQLEAARAALAEVRVELVEAGRQLNRSRELALKKLVSQAALDTAQATADQLQARLESTLRSVSVAERGVGVQQQLLDDTVVRAPFDGVITVKNAQPGEMISPLSAGGDGTRTGIGTLVDMDSLEIEVDVNENFINRVEPGQPVEAMLNAYPDWKIPAEVIAVIPTADRSKATVKVRIRIKLKDPRVIPDMGARVSFLATTPSDSANTRPLVLVSNEAVRRDAGGDVVFLVHGETVERRAVKVGGTRGSNVEIAAGLSGGETVALGELSKLADGARVKLEKE